MQRKVEEIIQVVATEHGIPVRVAKAIIESQFRCAREATKEGEAGNPATFKNIRFRHLGILVARPFRIKKIHENNLKKQKREDGNN